MFKKMIDPELQKEMLLFFHRRWKEDPINITRLTSFNEEQEIPIDEKKLEANAWYMIEHGLIKKPLTTAFETRISKHGVHVAEGIVYSPDVETREKILKIMKEAFDEDSSKRVRGSDLESTLGLSKIDILRNIMILEYDGLIDLQMYSGGISYSKISARGIDALEEPISINYEAELMKKAYENLYTLENALRRFLEKELYAEYGDDWWEEGASQKVREEAARVKANENGVEPDINYTLFPDLRLIIIRENNWKNRFETKFVTQGTFIARLEELEPIRNKIAHSRMLNDREILKLELMSKEILEKISS